ncbi:MAG: anti-sigma factor [Candidatus Promineofilum sp.]|nr:anti-sigma factor [Promineifilum sp.]
MKRNPRIEEELFPFYALDALTDEEKAEVENYVAANPAAAAQLAELTLAAAELSEVATPLTPTPTVKANLMARVEADLRATQPAAPIAAPAAARPATPRRQAKAPSTPWWRSFTPLLAGFAALALILSTLAIRQLAGQVGELRATVATLEAGSGTLQTRVDALATENDALRRELAGRDDLLAQYTQPGALTMTIGDITGQNPDARAVLTLDPTAEAATLRVANLPPLSGGDTYQAWLIVGETPVSAGTFTVDETGVATHVIPGGLPGPFDAMGISIEPAGGSETPTPGNIILLGSAF